MLVIVKFTLTERIILVDVKCNINQTRSVVGINYLKLNVQVISSSKQTDSRILIYNIFKKYFYKSAIVNNLKKQRLHYLLNLMND